MRVQLKGAAYHVHSGVTAVTAHEVASFLALVTHFTPCVLFLLHLSPPLFRALYTQQSGAHNVCQPHDTIQQHKATRSCYIGGRANALPCKRGRNISPVALVVDQHNANASLTAQPTHMANATHIHTRTWHTHTHTAQATSTTPAVERRGGEIQPTMLANTGIFTASTTR